MAQYSINLQKFFDTQTAQAVKRDKIAQAAYSAGIISNPAQRAVYDFGKMTELLDLYVQDLIRQATPVTLNNGKVKKGSTASPNKFIEVACRILYAADNGTPLYLHDFSCRSAGEADWTVSGKDAERHQVEIKSGRGELARGVSHVDTLQAFRTFCSSDSLIVWFYDLREFDYTAKSALWAVDTLPYVCMKKRDFVERLANFNGEIDTWLEVKENAINLQAVTTSNKKMRYLEEMARDSYDWKVYRKTGHLVKRGD